MLKYEKLVVGELSTNCYLVWSEEKSAVIIDPGDEGVEIAQRINELGLRPMAILLTHGHFDHILGAIELKLIFKIRIALSQEDAFLVERAAETAAYFLKREIKPIKIRQSTNFTQQIETIRLGGETIKVIKTPGHTPGGVCFYYKKEGWLFTGDTLFAEGLQGETTHTYSSSEQLLKSVKALLKLPKETLVLPGHGEETTIGLIING
jgi:hydroxyacylglutathione hydrolase